MKVLQLGKFYPIRGGVEKVMWTLAQGLSEAGVDCDMVCATLKPGEVDPEDRDKIVPGSEPQVLRFNEHGRVICLPAWKNIAATMICPAMIGWMRRHCKEYDIVHVHHPDPMACLALFLSGYKGKVVVHWHSDILKQKVILKFFKPLQDWMLRRADKILGTTPVYVQQSPHLQAYQDKIDYLPIGIQRMAPAPEACKEIRDRYHGKKIIFSLGRLVEYKGFSYLVEAAKYLPDDYIVAIGGTGPLKADLEAQITENSLGNKVALLGWMSDAEVDGWFHACDLFALSSVMKTEAFAIVQIEAMSCGKPVVSTDIPGSGVAWVNKHGDSGLVVPIKDPEAFAGAVVKILESDVVYMEFSQRALARFEANFLVDAMIRRCMDVYAAL